MSNQDITTRVAKAIYEGRNGPGCKPWAHLTKEHQKPYLADAQASGKIWTEAAATIIDSYAVQDTQNGKKLIVRQDGNIDGLYYADVIRILGGEAPIQTELDSQPRYTTTRLRDEVAKAKNYARIEALEDAARQAEKVPCEPGESIAAAIRRLKAPSQTEPHRVCRRPFRLSYAATAASSSMA